MRLFVALEVPEALKEALAQVQARGRQGGLTASWPDPATLHLTLAFLGEQPEALVPAAQSALRQAAAQHRPFLLRTADLGGFPRPSKARVVVLGLDPCPALDALAAAVRQSLAAAGVPFDPKPFRPHVTVGRLRVPGSVKALDPGVPPTTCPVQELVLFESRLARGGARHEALERIPLGGAGASGANPVSPEPNRRNRL